jgi:hypothetical protein
MVTSHARKKTCCWPRGGRRWHSIRKGPSWFAERRKANLVDYVPVVVRLALAPACALLLAATAFAATPKQPSERACLIAWNSPANHSGRGRLLAERPILGLMLRAGVSYVDTWTTTSTTRTGGPACLMTIVKHGKLRSVTGPWMTNGVDRWTFGRALAATRTYPPPGAANVRLLPDGRVTKIYRR